MTRSLGAFDPAAPRNADEPRFRFAPAEGWTALAALLVMLMAAAFAVDDSNWAGLIEGTEVRQTAFVPVAMFGAALLGLVLAKTSLSALAAHLVGAVVGAAFLLVAVAGSISTAPGLGQRLRDLSDSVATFGHEVVGLGIRSAETSVFLLILGALVWAAGQFAAFAVFRRRRAAPAIAVAVTLLLANMAITVEDQYLHVVALATAALWLLVRLNLMQQVVSWHARRIGDGGYVSGLFLRSGVAFVALAVVGSVTLAANASSAPLQRAWGDLDDELLKVGLEVNKWVGGVSGAARGPGNLFAPSQVIRDVWESSNELVFTAVTSDGRGHYWRGAAFDTFDGRGWQQTAEARHHVPAEQPVLAGTVEPLDTDVAHRKEIVATVTAYGLSGDHIVAPEAPHVVLDHDVEVLTREPNGNYAAMKSADGYDSGESFTVASYVPRGAGEPGALTANQLAAAGVDYPAWAARYVELREGTTSRRLSSEAARVVAGLPRSKRDPFHIAQAVERYLRGGGGFTYTINIAGQCAGEPRIDCFLRIRRGFCEHFASAMVLMLRTQQIPARYTVGFLPGKPVDGIWNVDGSAMHAWVEVYFPGYGWIRFDPTPGNQENGQTPSSFEAGAPVASPPSDGPQRTPSFERIERDPDDDESIGAGQAPITPGGDGMTNLLGPLALVATLLLVFAVLAVLALRRLPHTEPDRAYRSLVRIATRFGHGPRPTQTAYEFADGLGALVPAVRGDLRVVATAKVEKTYGRRRADGDALQQLRQAYARARLGLVRLVVRKPSRPRRPRGT